MEPKSTSLSNEWLSNFYEPVKPPKIAKKGISQLSQLDARSTLVLNHYHRLYSDHISRITKISGRSLELIFSRLKDTRFGYYIHHDDNGILQCSDTFTDQSELFFDVGSSYHTYLALLGKTFFDTFQRGILISFNSREVSICSLFFDRWCNEFGLFSQLDKLQDCDVVMRVPVQHRIKPTRFIKLTSQNMYRPMQHVKHIPLVQTRRPSFME